MTYMLRRYRDGAFKDETPIPAHVAHTAAEAEQVARTANRMARFHRRPDSYTILAAS